MNPPSQSDIEAAFEHGKWLRGEVVSGSDRMLADASYEIQRLREADQTFRDAMDELIEANVFLVKMQAISCGDQLERARERFNAAEMTARALIK